MAGERAARTLSSACNMTGRRRFPSFVNFGGLPSFSATLKALATAVGLLDARPRTPWLPGKALHAASAPLPAPPTAHRREPASGAGPWLREQGPRMQGGAGTGDRGLRLE